MSNCGNLSFGQKTTREAIEFWATNNKEHIEVLLNSAAGAGANLYPEFKQQLMSLKRDFSTIAEDAANNNMVMQRFMQKNKELIKLLERLKFEGYNGFPILYEAVLHFIYEAKYAADAINSIYTIYGPSSVLFTVRLRGMGVGSGLLECCYGQMYFWSLIGAQHPSLLMNVTPKEASALPRNTRELLWSFTNDFNRLTYSLSGMYPKLNRNGLLKIHDEYMELNEEFLRFLNNFKTNQTMVPYTLRPTLPQLFTGVLDHIIHETEDAITIGNKIENALQ